LVAGIGSEGPAAEQPSSQAGGSGGLLEGLAVLRWQPDTRALLGMFAVGYLAWGTLDVLAVVLALGVLELGGSGAGYLTAAFGGGAVLGGMGALALVGAPTLALPLAVAALGWAVAFAVLGLWPTTVGAFLLLLAAGVSNAVMDVSGRTLLARAAPSHVLARVFGVLEGLSMAALAVGAALVPVLVSVGGARLALIGVAAILALAVPLALPRLRALDRRGVAGPELALLRGHELFAALPAPALEGLAHDLVAVDLRAGEVVIRQGDVGDRFYLVDTGRLEVTVDGVPVATLGAGAGFGEIALIHDVPRTAAVTALSECRLYALAREPFRDALVPAV
jgi:MFS family permease